MALGSQTSGRQKEEEAVEAVERTGMDPAVIASGASVLLSWHYFFLKGNRMLGIFVGLWPPTILAFASYFKQTQMSDMIEKATQGGSMVRKINDRVDRVLGQQ